MRDVVMKRAMVAMLAMAVAGCSAQSAHGDGAAQTAGVRLESIGAGRAVRVSSLAELQRAVDAATPGTRVVLANGKYSTDKPITIDCAGNAQRPIVIDAEQVGGAEIQGKAGFTFGEKAAYTAVQGFVFTHATVTMNLPAGTKHLRVTRNVFALSNHVAEGTKEAPDVTVSGDDCEIDHNTFRDKHTEGPMVTVQGPGKDQMAQRTWIHHNLFSNFMPTSNNCSAIQIGLSWRSMASGHSLTEFNLFEKCRGENEGAVCNKSCDNVYRYNTFSEGTRELSLRHGNRCEVYGNYFLNTDGLRFFGHDHRIYSNYFEGCSPAIHVGNGDATIPPGRLQMHDEPVGVQVVFNTLVDNKKNIVMAPRGKPFGAANIAIANNVIVGGGPAAAIEGPLAKSKWEGNIVWKTEAGSIPAGGFVMMDPGLVKGNDGVLHAQPESAVVGKSVGNYPYVTVDVEGQARRGKKDVGADQAASAPTMNRVLTEKDVGPEAK